MGIAAALTILLLQAAEPPGSAQPRLQGSTEALAQDAVEYARDHAVPLDEAMRRLRAQEESVAATDRIAEAYGGRLAGIAIEHAPDYRIVVLLTGDAPVPDATIAAGGMAVPIVFRTGAPATRAHALAAIREHQAEIRAAMSLPPGLGVDPRTGRLVVTTSAKEAARFAPGELAARFTALTGLPTEIRILDRDLNLSVEGGARVVGIDPTDGRRYACTTGFSVVKGDRTGIVTAAHCPDALSYVDPVTRAQTPLEFVGQWGWSYYDVQVHVGATEFRPLFYADTPKTKARPVITWRNRNSTRAGDYVCHRGERTGYSCAEVELVDYAPPGDLCGGPCAPTWVTVRGPGCKSGDSGAPVFLGNTAFGIVKGGSYRPDGTCGFYFYMSTDFLPDGWSLLYRGAADASPLPEETTGGIVPPQ